MGYSEVRQERIQAQIDKIWRDFGTLREKPLEKSLEKLRIQDTQ